MDDLDRGIKLMNSGTAVGIDHWSPYHWKRLSPEAKEILLDILRDIEQAKAWPGYAYYNNIVLMGKPAGGVRPIALMAMIYRLSTKIRRPYIVQWERAHAGLCDAAIKGSSALRASIGPRCWMRRLSPEGRIQSPSCGTWESSMTTYA